MFFLTTNISSAFQEDYTIATVRILDKITAKSSIVDIKIGEKYNYASLGISIYQCWNAPLDQKPETKILIRVEEERDEKKQNLFFGWLFASSPSISSIEHPIYDITAIKCK